MTEKEFGDSKTKKDFEGALLYFLEEAEDIGELETMLASIVISGSNSVFESWNEIKSRRD